MDRMTLVKASRSIEELEAIAWPEPPSDAPDFVRRCHSLRQVPISELEVDDLRVLIRQDIALKYLMPLALPLLKVNPLLEAEYYPGDLLCAAMGVTPEFWKTSSGEYSELVTAAELAQAKIYDDTEPERYRQISKDIAQFLKSGGTR